MSDIFTEVDETLRQEKMESLWKRWRPFVYAGVILLVGGVAANEFVWRPYLESQRAERALALENAVKALEEGRYADAEAGFSAIMQSDPKMAAMAAHFLAQTLYEGGGDIDGAAEVLASVGGTEAGPYERLALLKAAYFRADAMSLDELELSLGSLVGDNSALGALARELVAAKAFEAGDYARARTEFNRLRFDPAAPQGVIRRADVALAAIPVPTGTEPETTPAPEPDAPAEPQETGQ
ncbi:MAG: tetratricopeptide repeat protein [Hyphomonas sp.]